MTEIVNLSNIYKSFGAVQALIDFNLSINEGEIVGLMGDNGAGKSTLLKILAYFLYQSQLDLHLN